MNEIEKLFLLFEHPLESLVFPRRGGRVCFEIPEAYRTNRLKELIPQLTTSKNNIWTSVQNFIKVETMDIPDLSFAFELKPTDTYSEFIPKHREIAGTLIKILMDHEKLEDLLSVSVYCREHLNPYLFIYALMVVLQHKPETRDEIFPAVFQMFPDHFFEPSTFLQMKEEWKYPEESRMRVNIPMNYTASELEIEQRLAYFREDIGINMSHWHWHVVYPDSGPAAVVNKDRRGELFYYMHSQIMARYNVERLCNQMPPVEPLKDFREPIPQAYFPKLVRGNTGKSYVPRIENSTLKDLSREDVNVKVSELESWRDRILAAINSGFVVDESGNEIFLDAGTGIDILGNIIESSSLSVNQSFYGNLHNMGHNLIALIHDPLGKHLEDPSVMGSLQTAMRDPLFYRWHGFINDLFQKLKSKFPKYTRKDLEVKFVEVSKIEVQMVIQPAPPNHLITYWQKSEVDLGSGLDFGPGNVQVSFTHLQHVNFNYKISIINSDLDYVQGTCRIFCCPALANSESFDDQRNLMIELDKFSVNLKPGENLITRHSSQSSVTIPYERTFKRVDQQTENFCGCGWPDHVLIPKGTVEGMSFFIFVMISNYDDDLVDGPMNQWDRCNDAHSFCGLRDMRYPDKRSMGFPFDRPIHVNSLEDFVKGYDNMNVQEITIRFQDTVVDKNREADMMESMKLEKEI